jgi:hypothetical protein
MATRYCWLLSLLPAFAMAVSAPAQAERTAAVFVALCDNVHQGIVPVGAKIGNGEDPANNLYWGTADGLVGVFDHRPAWKRDTAFAPAPNPDILDARAYRHEGGDITLRAFAYRGSAIKQCLLDFEAAIRERQYDLVVYIGHNGLMDFDLALSKETSAQPGPDCIVLCCKSNAYFRDRIAALGGTPRLLTTQFMYPGAFLLHDAIEPWRQDGDNQAIRAAAGRAYAKNQGISQKAALGVFADLGKTP